MTFIKATETFNTFDAAVAAPYLRKSIVLTAETKATVRIAACGFYEFWLNGKRLTKGLLAPYISNTDHYVYYDEYDVTLAAGETVIGLLLGNGFQNNPGGYIWDFDQSPFRSAPMVAVTVSAADGSLFCESDASWKTTASPITADDYRFGEHYDANREIPGWNLPGFDDSAWQNAIVGAQPKGKVRKCDADPIRPVAERKPVEIVPFDGGYIYDFGVCDAGVCRLTINGTAGQTVTMQHADWFDGKKFYLENVWFVREHWERDKKIVNKDFYTCKGGETEVYQPTFTYHGFRYVFVEGITAEQATPELLTYVVLHSDLHSRGDFACSDQTANKLQELTRRSDLSNFHYFPTDCPQREKNGWTADAALSSEHLLLNFNPERSYRQWLANICAAQDERGALPGIVPTGGWGFSWGNGPAWDSVLAYLPYFVYQYRGTTDMIVEAADAFEKYLHYLLTRVDEKGLMHIGLGDWCHANRRGPKAPLELTDTVMCKDIADKMALMFAAVGMHERAAFARECSAAYKQAIRTHLIDFATMTVAGDCQTSQAMCIFYGIVEGEEADRAFARLMDFIREADDHLDVGVLGGRVLFHVLTAYGESDLAYKMIVRPDFPSYGNWIELGATTLWEGFWPQRTDENGKQFIEGLSSMNHHFWGDISAWFIMRIAGICVNPQVSDASELTIAPSFIAALDWAEGWHMAPTGKITSAWKRENGVITLKIGIPAAMRATAKLPKGYAFADGATEKAIESGIYEIRAL